MRKTWKSMQMSGDAMSTGQLRDGTFSEDETVYDRSDACGRMTNVNDECRTLACCKSGNDAHR